MPSRTSPFDDRTVTLRGALTEFARVAEVLSSPTRLAILSSLQDAKEPLHINEVARRVGVDASPVRTHLEILLKAGLVDEIPDARGRLRRFTTRLENATLALEGVNRVSPVAASASAKPKEVQRLERKLAGYEKQRRTLDEKARRVKKEMEAAWSRAASEKRAD